MNDGRSAARGRIKALASVSLALPASLFMLDGCVPTTPRSDAGVVAPEVRLGDCETAEQGLEFAPFKIADFEPLSTAPGAPIAQFMYTYTDNTSVVQPTGYQQPATTGKHCTSDLGTGIFHLTGGPFLGWGGGLGIAMQHLSQEAGGGRPQGLCVLPVGGGTRPDYCPPPGADPSVAALLLDASQWDGVAVWARRGPTSQPLLRVLVGNKYTDDDVSFTMYNEDPTLPRYCERVRECACINGLPCAFTTIGNGVPVGGGYYCGPPGIVMGPDIPAAGSGQIPTNTCNTTRCDEDYSAYPGRTDAAFHGRQCRPFTYRSGVTSSFCYDPDGVPSDGIHVGRAPDPPPAETDQQCGDHWTFPLHLTTDWQLYLVPFTSMLQQGFAKRFPFFDLKSVSVVRLTWDAGPIDYYIDDLSFYRVARP